MNTGRTTTPTLARRIGLFFLIVYGVGDIVGSGIYGTIGVAAGAMGNAVWLAFLAAMVAAILTGLTYASISSRYPRAAGAAYVTQRAFRAPLLSYLVGLAVMASGLTSIATACNVFARNLAVLLGGPPLWLLMVAFLVALTAINLWGIRESMWANLVCTVIEVGGLLFIIAIGMRYWGGVDYLATPQATPGHSGLGLSMLLTGAVLTFYSFVGFEDMINVAEEVKEPERTMPWGLIAALTIATLLYIAVSITAVSAVPATELADVMRGAPLVQITRRIAPWLSPSVFNAITLFAVANTALLNYVMGSRLAYGMACQGLLPRYLGAVNARRRTPHHAILTLFAAALILALIGNIPNLARATALLLLSVFAVINLALLVLKARPHEPRGRFEVPALVPACGIGACLVMIAHAKRGELAIVGVLLGIILVLYALLRPKPLPEDEA
ncbi:MAG: APC family permease [Candidatus Eisenbacteria bacterium]